MLTADEYAQARRRQRRRPATGYKRFDELLALIFGARAVSEAPWQESIHQDLRLPDERVRLGQDGRRACARRKATSRRRTSREADLILFNTCSVREKAQEKVFSDLGRVKHLKAKGRADRRRRLRRQPGRRGHHRARALCRRGVRAADAAPPARAAARSASASSARRWTSASRRSRSSTICRRRASKARPPSSRIMEGCSKYCSYCVVPYTRGEEVSRPFDDVLAEVAGLADQGVKEVTLLGQNVNAYRGAMGGTDARDRRLRAADRIRGRDPRHRAHPLHHQPSERIHAAADRRLRQGAASW